MKKMEYNYLVSTLNEQKGGSNLKERKVKKGQTMLDRLKKRKIGLVFLSIQALLTVGLAALLIMIKFLKPLYIIAIVAVLIVLLVLMVMGQGSRGKAHIPFKVAIALFCVLLCVGSYYIYIGYDTGKTVTNPDVTDEFSVIVLKDSPAVTLEDVKGEEFGVDVTQKQDAYTKTMGQIQTEIAEEVRTREYVDSLSLVKALYNKECKVIILNSAVLSDIMEEYPNFKSETRVLNTYEHVTNTTNTNGVKSITEEPFSVFISGIDTYGDISNKSRSDVNIIATINPKTKQLLLTSTPRDYYVKTSVSGDKYDKLTHAGIYGVECSVETLEMLYGIEINYYAKVNFTGFESIVDALGSITVHSDYAFTAQHGETFKKGDNVVDGKKALAFARERHAFPSGDLQRNKNQQEIIKAIIKKLASPAILGGFTSIMDAVKGNVLTDISYDEIATIVQMQLDEGSSWQISTFGVSGKGGSSTTYSNQSKSGYVMYMDEEKIQEAAGYMKQVINGEVPNIETK